jgi:hypothetical protein
MAICPISNSQLPYRTALRSGGVQLPNGSGALVGGPANSITGISLPIATADVASIVRTVNAIVDVLRSMTTSLTVNNVHNPAAPITKQKGDTFYSQYPTWEQVKVETTEGYMYHHAKNKPVDKTQQAHVERIKRVVFHNVKQEDPEFVWAYQKKLDATIV